MTWTLEVLQGPFELLYLCLSPCGVTWSFSLMELLTIKCALQEMRDTKPIGLLKKIPFCSLTLMEPN